jgi:hypothetical protein
MVSTCRAAFITSLDLEGNAPGAADALLRELPYVLEDTGIYLPPMHMIRSHCRSQLHQAGQLGRGCA